MLEQSRLLNVQYFANKTIPVIQRLLVVSKKFVVYLLISKLPVVVLSTKSSYLKNILEIWESNKDIIKSAISDAVNFKLLVLISILNFVPIEVPSFEKVADLTKVSYIIIKKERKAVMFVIDFDSCFHYKMNTCCLYSILDQTFAELLGVTVFIS